MALAYATDLATGHSRDFALRSCVLGMRLAEVAGLDVDARRNVYHQALLRYIGCNADTHLLASAFGDEIALRRDLSRIDIGNKSELGETIVRAITRTFSGAPPAELAKAVERGLAEAMQVSVPILAYPEPLFQNRRQHPGRRRPLRARARAGATEQLTSITARPLRGSPPS